MLLDTYKRYFDEVVTGIDKLMEERGRFPCLRNWRVWSINWLMLSGHLQNGRIRLRGQEQQKNDLVVYLAHDIKTP